MNDINALIGSGCTLDDKRIFFGSNWKGKKHPCQAVRLSDGEMFVKFPYGITFPKLLKETKFFKSTSDAIRNGWGIPVPDGYSEYTIGKLRRRLTILKIGGKDDIA